MVVVANKVANEAPASIRMFDNSAISLVDVSKRYHRDVPLVENASLQLNYGELAVLIGPSGSGKSTILQMVAGLLDPDSGEVTVGEQKVFSGMREKGASENKRRSRGKLGEELSSDLRRTLLSYVPQEDYLLESLNVFENVALALDLRGDKVRDRNERVERTLRDLEIEELKDRMADEVSAGERRRCALGRGLVRDPLIFLADEPTSSLDIEGTKNLMKMLNAKRSLEREDQKQDSHSRKMAILIASHDVAELEPFADKIYEIRNHTLEKRPKSES